MSINFLVILILSLVINVFDLEYISKENLTGKKYAIMSVIECAKKEKWNHKLKKDVDLLFFKPPSLPGLCTIGDIIVLYSKYFIISASYEPPPDIKYF